MSSIHVKLDGGKNYFFQETFVIGREDECEITLVSSQVSRMHARVEYLDGTWYIEDLQSTNGTYINQQKVTRIALRSPKIVHFGLHGPSIELHPTSHLQHPTPPSKTPNTYQQNKANAISPQRNTSAPSGDTDLSPGAEQATHSASKSYAPPIDDVNKYVDHYFGDGNAPAGEHTMFIRTAFRAVQSQQKKQYITVILIIATLCIGAIAFGLYQNQQRHALEKLAKEQFQTNKKLDLRIASFRKSIEDAGVNFDDELRQLEADRLVNDLQYEGYIRELGIHKSLSPKEKAIYDMARIFNESSFGMPYSFVGEVLDKIENHWLTTHRDRYIRVLRQAEQKEYTGYIVQAMMDRGLPPEFFYVALQESDLQVNQSGPRTSWGIAKGMWQFIPATATRFGLQLGPRVDQRMYDPLDERHDFFKSTDAASRYLQEIYSTLAQASGLLVIASYNWGEHRIEGRLNSLADEKPLTEEIFAGIPVDPEHRNYWAFLTTYRNRMPEETKNYVLEIFSAAVIGHNPRLWGLDMDNPLDAHIEAYIKTNE